MEPASTPSAQAPSGFDNPVLINSPLTGMCRGAAATDPRSGLGLWFITDAEISQGSYCPVKISDVDGVNTVTTMGRVLNARGGDSGTEVIMSLPREDEKLVKALTAWFPLSPMPAPAPEALGSGPGFPVPRPAVDAPAPEAPAAPLPEGLHATRYDGDDDEELLDLTDLAETLSTGQQKAVSNEVVRFQYESLMGEADSLESQGQFAQAFLKVEKALSIYPIYADDLHMRLAKLAMADGQHKMALSHAENAQRLNPSRRDASHLIRQINSVRSSAYTEKIEKSRKFERRNKLMRTVGSVLLFLLVIAPTTAYNVYTYLIPHGPMPEPLALDSFDDLIEADKALFQNGVVYFFVGDDWKALDKQAKEEKVLELVSRTKRLLDSQRVVITDAEPRLLATANNERVKVYR